MAKVEMEVAASFALEGTATVDLCVVVDSENPTPQQLADLVERNAPNPRVCHQCASEISDPALGELVAFSIGDRYYQCDDGVWTVS